MKKSHFQEKLEKAVHIIKKGGVGVLPTDTIYGIVGSALSREPVERIYELRRRNLAKPLIVLISSKEQLKLFGISLTESQKKRMKEIWPGKVSIVLPCALQEFFYLHRGTESIAFRIPDLPWLREMLVKTGPLVAPSANFEGEKSASTIEEAKGYFGSEADFYVDGGVLESKPSTILSIDKDGTCKVLREGAVKI